MNAFNPHGIVLEALTQRLRDVEKFLAIEEAADRGADADKIERLRRHAIALRAEIKALEVRA
jgi:hypothetical protein